jgi:hypothetical protein
VQGIAHMPKRAPIGKRRGRPDRLLSLGLRWARSLLSDAA